MESTGLSSLYLKAAGTSSKFQFASLLKNVSLIPFATRRDSLMSLDLPQRSMREILERIMPPPLGGRYVQQVSVRFASKIWDSLNFQLVL